MNGDIFSALADQTRRAILQYVADEPQSAGQIASLFPQQRPAISKHISALKDAGLLLETRDRQRRLYTLNRAGLGPLSALLADLHPRPRVPDVLPMAFSSPRTAVSEAAESDSSAEREAFTPTTRFEMDID